MPFFNSLGFQLPERKGVADFLQEVTSEKDQKVCTRAYPLKLRWLMFPVFMATEKTPLAQHHSLGLWPFGDPDSEPITVKAIHMFSIEKGALFFGSHVLYFQSLFCG